MAAAARRPAPGADSTADAARVEMSYSSSRYGSRCLLHGSDLARRHPGRLVVELFNRMGVVGKQSLYDAHQRISATCFGCDYRSGA